MKQEQKISNGVKKLQKPIAIILIIGLVLSVNFNLFVFKPKPVQAFDVIGGPSQIINTIKEMALDTIAHTITQLILNSLTQKIMDWGMGRKSVSNEPFQVRDWVQFFRNAAIKGTAKFIVEQYENLFDLSSACENPLKKVLDSLGFSLYPRDLTYSQYARPTLTNDLSILGIGCQEFIDSGYSMAKGGWSSWFSLMEPQNNVFGQALMAQQERARRIMEEEKAADKQTAVSGGYIDETATIATDIDKCKENCAAAGPPSPDCLQKCERLPGVAIQTQIKNWGSDINKLMGSALGADMQRLISVDEITQLLGVLFSALIMRAVDGIGLAFSASTSTKSEATRTQTKSAYSYQRIFKKEQTTEDIKDVRSQTLNNILKSIQQLSRSITKCGRSDDEKMVKYDDFVKNLDDLFSPNVEGLYIGLEGINLKPDFEVLDPRFAPYTVYGYSWGEVPASKFPNKCETITDQLNLGANATCQSIRTGLEPNVRSQCQQCMYDHDSLNCPPAPYPPQAYPTTGQEPWTKTILKEKSDYWWDCNNQYNLTLDRCDECLKKADEKCSQLDDPAQKNQCIINQCGNFSDIANNFITPLPANPDSAALTFYNRCLKEEAKDACFTCLKEYFMPATYCEQTGDYTARALIKYPAVVKKVRSGLFVPDHEIWLGPYDKTFGEMMGGDCDNNDEAESIDLAIICRIMPGFKYEGEKVCETRCSQAGLTGQALTDALKDITDFRPNSQDCGNLKLPIGGKETWTPINDGVFHTKGKCCGALHAHDAKKYAACVGEGTTTQIPPEECPASLIAWETPECYCDDGERPITDAKNLRPLYKCPSGVTCQAALEGWENVCRNSCKASGFTVPSMSRLNQSYIVTNVAPGGGVIAVSTNACRDNPTCYVKGGNSSCVWPDSYYSADPGGEIACSQEVYRSTDAGDCCAPEVQGAIREIGAAYITCDLSSYAGRNLYLNTYANEADDCKTHSLLCIPCDPNDPGYPNYGTSINQCENKHPRSWR